MMNCRTLILVVLSLFASLGAHAQTPETSPGSSDAPPFLGLWITRWDYRSASDVTDCIIRADSLGATDIFWQVRGQADAYYRSELEPWGRELLRDLPPDATEPAEAGYDPLALAIRLAHERGMKLHAWVNIMPLWKGKVPPPPHRQAAPVQRSPGMAPARHHGRAAGTHRPLRHRQPAAAGRARPHRGRVQGHRHTLPS